MLPNPSNTAFGDGAATRETNLRRISKVARRKKILTGLLARRNRRSRRSGRVARIEFVKRPKTDYQHLRSASNTVALDYFSIII